MTGLVRAGTRLVTVAVASAAIAGPASAAPSVFSGHSGWFWANPLPQGNTLRAVEFSGARGYAVGDFGTVMRSDDGGITWSGLTTGTTTPLRILRLVSPDVLVVAGKCEARRSDDGGSSFRSLPWAPPGSACRAKIAAVAFPTRETGYLFLTDGRVFRSSDSGTSWSARTAVPGTAAVAPGSQVQPTDAAFTAATTGFVITSGGTILRTTDGGNSWSPIVTHSMPLNGISFTDAQNGRAVGGNSVTTTTDGGQTWTERPLTAPGEELTGVRCGDSLNCVATTKTGDELLFTHDGAKTWSAISPATLPLFAAAFSTATQLVAVGQAGTMVDSADGGHNFQTISGELAGSFTIVRGGPGDVGYAGGKAGALAKTSDGGAHWSLLAPPVSGPIIDLSFPSEATGFALTTGNVLMRTDDGGRDWSLIDPGTFVPVRAVVATDGDNIMLVTQRGVRVSDDGGLNFVRARSRAVAQAALVGGGRAGHLLYAYGPHAIAISPDVGVSWRAGAIPGRHERVVKVDLETPTIGYALTSDGRGWRTLDGAHSWQEMPGLGTEVGVDLVFDDIREGFVSIPQFGNASGGYVLRTTDGGVTWRPQLVDSVPIAPGALAAPSTGTAFAVTRGDHVLATNRGGDIGQRSTLTLSVKRLRPGKPGVIAITGTLSPARGGETIVVSKRAGRSSHWLYQNVTVASSGRFSVFTQVTRTTAFVAQWAGDDQRVGAGTPALEIGIGKRFARDRSLVVRSALRTSVRRVL